VVYCAAVITVTVTVQHRRDASLRDSPHKIGGRGCCRSAASRCSRGRWQWLGFATTSTCGFSSHRSCQWEHNTSSCCDAGGADAASCEAAATPRLWFCRVQVPLHAGWGREEYGTAQVP
jgi:hypothetical protein